MAKNRRKILVVDDDPHIVRLLGAQLKAPGREILEAQNGLEAIKTALRESPDLVILDVMMPRIDGYQVCRFLRCIPALFGMRILFLTVKHGVGDRQRGLLQGADDYLNKPFDLDELEEKVSALLNVRSSHGALSAGLSPLLEVPPPDEITDEVVVSLMNRILDENLHRLTLLEKISQRLQSAVDREEILRTMLAGVVSPLGLAWDRALLMAVNWERGALEAELGFSLDENPGDGLPRWRQLLRICRDRTMEELLDEGLKGFRFQTPASDQWLSTLRLKIDGEKLEDLSGTGEGTLDALFRVCRGKKPDAFLSSVFWNSEVTIVPVAGREKIFGLLCVDRFFSHGRTKREDVDHLLFLCRQAGLALERQILHQRVQVRAWEYERLSLLSESIINGIDLGVTFLDREGRVVTWNSAMERFTGKEREQVEGRSFFKVFSSLAETLVGERYKKSVKGKTSQRVGHFGYSFGPRRKGTFDVRFGMVRQGRKIIGTVMIWEDVELRVTLERKTREAHRYLDSLVAHSGDAIFTLDGRGRIRSWNRGAQEIFGHSYSDIVGRSFSNLFEKDNRKAAKQILTRTREEGRVVNHLETCTHREGDSVEVSIATSVVGGAGSGQGDVAVIIRDISERRRMESQLFQTEKLASLGIMAAGMAHEINNPLTSIMMYSQILTMSQGMGEEDRNCIDRIEEDAGRIADIVNSLLVFARPSSRKSEEVDLHEMVEKAISFIKYQAGSKNISINRFLDESVPPLSGVATEVQEVFLNLLINARDALPEGGEIVVRSRYHSQGSPLPPGFAAETEKGFVEVEVADEGEGIPRELLRKIYDPFFTTKAPGKGTGLGLAVVQRLVENHQGHITVRSTPGKGTTFTVYFPAG